MPFLTSQQSRLLGNRGIAMPVPTLGNELFTNTGFDLDTGWTKGAGWSIADGVATATGAANNANLYQKKTVANHWYVIGATITSVSGGGFAGKLGSLVGPAFTSPGALRFGYFANSDFTNFCTQGVTTGSIDDATCKEIALSTLFNARPFGTNQATQVNATILLGMSAGVVCNLDSLSNPQNYVIGLHNGLQAILAKCVGGALSELIGVTVTYVAGATIKVQRLAASNTYKLFYNGAQVGANQTIADAGIISNTLHGVFNTSASNTLAAFSCVAS